jgi:prepilin-type N-terminal cleavage/methylation domain-containing protein
VKGFTVVEFMIVLAIIGIIFATVLTVPYQCRARWERSGMAAEWGFFTGCQVEVEPGRWIPSDRVREIELPRKK